MTETQFMFIALSIAIIWCMNSAWRAWLRHKIEFKSIKERDSTIMKLLLAQKKQNESSMKRLEMIMQVFIRGELDK